MKWIYLSPHLDDVVYSCGGLIWEQVQTGIQVEIWTVCAGNVEGQLSPYAQSLHTRWQTGPEAVAVRRAEDLEACRELGVVATHLDIPDCIYRRLPDSGAPVVERDEDLFSLLKPGEVYLVKELTDRLEKSIPLHASLVCPLAMGGHMDHRLARMAAEALNRPLWFYADFPYVLREGEALAHYGITHCEPGQFQITEAALAAWQEGVAAYRSQISTFWGGTEEMKTAIHDYWLHPNSRLLWHCSQVV